MPLVECVNKSFTRTHLVSTDSKKTKCGLKWHRRDNPRKQRVDDREVWIPDAAMFAGSEGKCRRCFV